MNVLVTGGRSPYTLEIIRLLGKAGHRVVAVEFVSIHLSRFSKYVDTSYTICSPVKDFQKFKADFLAIVKSEKIDLVLPSCEEIFHLSRIKKEIDEISKCFFEDFEFLRSLHSKFEFMKGLGERGISHPMSYILAEYRGELKGKKVVLKKDFSRFASNVHIVPEEENTRICTEKSEWVIQEFIPGQEGSIYVQVNHGQICAYSCYLKEYSIEGGATILFKHHQSEKILNWTKNFFNGLNRKVTGQFSFDFILDKENNIFPIECNPRPTSGVHLFSGNTDFARGYFAQTELIEPKAPLQMMLGLAMIIYAFSMRKASSWKTQFSKSQDVIFSYDDLLPFFVQFMSFAYFICLSIIKGVKVVEATTIDIEYNG